MASSLRLASRVDQPPAQHAFAARSDDRRRGAESPAGDQELARFTRVNLFVIGGDDVVAKLVTSLLPSLATPVVVRHRGEPLQLTPTSPPVGTVVVYDVDTLSRQEQHALHQWISAGTGRSRVVSTASASLLPVVEAGVFNDALYYRLNVVTVNLTPAVAR